MTTEDILLKRSDNKCELCSTDLNLSVYEVPHRADSSEKGCVLICETCLKQVENPEDMDTNHWHCLNESMWSEFPAVQVMAWRILSRLSDNSWARELLDQLYLDDETLSWAQVGTPIDGSDEGSKQTVDSNGAILSTGDTVTLIKDLVVKGANFTAKRGTVVKKISLTGNPAQIEGRVNGTQIVLLTCYLKKA